MAATNPALLAALDQAKRKTSKNKTTMPKSKPVKPGSQGPGKYNPPRSNTTPSGRIGQEINSIRNAPIVDYSNPGSGTSLPSPGGSTPAPAPKPNLDEWRASDSSYLSTIAGIDRALKDYLAQTREQKSMQNRNLDRDLGALGEARTKAVDYTGDDFSGRGLLRSGMYAGALGDTNKEYDKRGQDYRTATADVLSGLSRGLANYRSEADLNKQRARAEAAARYAMQFGA